MNIPATKHWAIITTSRIYIPGDERSRTNPGHGYPEHYEETINYESFTDYDKFCKKVEQLAARKDSFIAIEAHPFEVKTRIEVSLIK